MEYYLSIGSQEYFKSIFSIQWRIEESFIFVNWWLNHHARLYIVLTRCKVYFLKFGISLPSILDAPSKIFLEKMQDLKLNHRWQKFQSCSYYSSRITEFGIFHLSSRWNNSSWQAPNFSLRLIANDILLNGKVQIFPRRLFKKSV